MTNLFKILIVLASLTVAIPKANAMGSVTNVVIEDLSSIGQHNVPITIGQTFSVGDVPVGNILTGSIGTSIVPLQLNAKALHSDGSLRHGIISFILPKTLAGQSQQLMLNRRPEASGPPLPKMPSYQLDLLQALT